MNRKCWERRRSWPISKHVSITYWHYVTQKITNAPSSSVNDSAKTRTPCAYNTNIPTQILLQSRRDVAERAAYRRGNARDCLNISWDTRIVTEFRDFPQFVQANAGITP
jgi:hypothetical protein